MLKKRDARTRKRFLAWMLSIVTVVTAVMSSVGMAKAEEPEAKIAKEIAAFAITEETIEAEKGTLAEIMEELPEGVGVTLADGTEEEIPASWECGDDYENTDYGIYTFSLVLPEGYVLGEGLTEWSLPYVEVRILGEENRNTRIQYDPNPGGTTTIDKVLGCTGDIVSWLESHEGDGYYLGTPYARLDEENPDSALLPNGEAGGSGQMNCTGFVASVLRHEGADLTKIGTRRPGWYANASNWQDYAHNSSVRVYRFETVSAALASGVLQKGDILYFEPNNWEEEGADCHIGFFWGDTPGQNRFWHSATHPERGNQISAIEPKTANSALYVFPVSHTGWIELQKSSANPAMTANNRNYSLAGAEYGIFFGGSKIATLKTDAKGYAKSGKLAPGRYVIRETKASHGYAIDTKSYQVTVQAEQAVVVNVAEVPRSAPADILLRKLDAETSGNAPQGNASLAGAQFRVKFYTRQMEHDPAEEGEKPERTWVFQTDAEGKLRFQETYLVEGDALYFQADKKTACFPLGTVTVQEVKAPQGYLLNPAIFTAQIKGEGNTETIQAYQTAFIPEQVIRGGVKVQKRDLETQGAEPQGNASFRNIEFQIRSLNTNPVIVEGKSYEKNQVVMTLHADEKGAASTESDALPYGEYLLEETEAPEGYLKEGKLSEKFSVVKDGEIVDLTSADTAVLDQVIRGDLAFVKVADGDQKRLANVPFSITSKTTGESHTIVTDVNGYANTSASWNKHTANTNAGKSCKDGVWFGSSQPDDKKGALIYDTYLIEEQRCESNQGMELLQVEVQVYRDHVTVQLGTLTDNRIVIGTTALDKESETHMSQPKEKVTVIDTIEYDGLKKGQTYRMKGRLMDAENGDPILVDGKEVTAETEFTANRASGTTQVEFQFDATSLSGEKTVIYEELYQKERLLAVHADLEETSQQIRFPEIKTQVRDRDTNEAFAKADENVTLVDTIFYKGLIPGEEYLVKGTLMDQETGEMLLVEGEPVTAEVAFTPDTEEGEWEVLFQFDGSSLKGKTVVVFETILCRGKEVAVHADLEDEGQTLMFPEIKTQAECPETGSQMALPKKELTITDTVSYHLVPGKEYKLIGTLMEKESGNPLLVNGNPVTSEVTFTPEEADGSVELSFTFDASALKGKTVVAFESVSYQEKEVAVHVDIESVPQSIYFPAIRTTARDGSDNDQELTAGKELTVVDTVEYQNVETGQEYAVVGTLMEKTTGKPLENDGKSITSEAVFEAEKAEGDVEVVFTFDGSELAGHEVVVFEKLYLVKGKDRIEITSHEDLEDEGQTVKVVEKETPKPGTPGTPKTGDGSNVHLWLLLAAVSAVGIVFFGAFAGRKKKEEE